MIANPRLHTRVCRGVCSYIRGRSGVQSTHGIYPDLWCSGRVTARAAISRHCGGGDGGLIASARSGSRRLRQTQRYRRNADRNHSKPNRFDLIHIISLRPRRPLFERPIFHQAKYSARTEPLRLRRRRIFPCYAWGDRHFPVRDRMEQVPGGPARRTSAALYI